MEDDISVQNRRQKLKLILKRALNDDLPSINDLSVLFKAQGREIFEIAQVADILRERQAGNPITYVVNRNINFTNICINHCLFCGFSVDENSKDAFIDLSYDSLARKIKDTYPYSITEVCVQGGIHPQIEFNDYCNMLENINHINSSLHIHAFSPQELKYAASISQMDVEDVLNYVQRLNENFQI